MMRWSGLALALCLPAHTAAALDCAEILAPFEIAAEAMQAGSDQCDYLDLTLDAGDGGSWTMRRASIRGTGIGQAGVPLQDVEFRIDNARPVPEVPAGADAPRIRPTTTLGDFTRDGSTVSVGEFIFATTGAGQIIADGRLLDVPDSLDPAQRFAFLSVRAEDLSLTVEVEDLSRALAQFGIGATPQEIAAAVQSLATAMAGLDGQQDSAAALQAVADEMPDPGGRLKIETGPEPVLLAAMGLAMATGNARLLAESGVRFAWTPAR